MSFDDHEPVSTWFELTYSSYLVLHRSVMEAMPVEWQRKFVALLEEAREAARDIKDLPTNFQVRAKINNKYAHDPYADYRRGPRPKLRKAKK